MQQKLLSGVGSGVGGRSLKLAVAEGRTYGAETGKGHCGCGATPYQGSFERLSRTGAAGSRLANGAV